MSTHTVCDGALRRTVIQAIDYEAVCRSGHGHGLWPLWLWPIMVCGRYCHALWPMWSNPSISTHTKRQQLRPLPAFNLDAVVAPTQNNNDKEQPLASPDHIVHVDNPNPISPLPQIPGPVIVAQSTMATEEKVLLPNYSPGVNTQARVSSGKD